MRTLGWLCGLAIAISVGTALDLTPVAGFFLGFGCSGIGWMAGKAGE